MKHTPQRNAQILGLHSPAISLAGTRRQKADQLMKMFDEAKPEFRGKKTTVAIEKRYVSRVDYTESFAYASTKLGYGVEKLGKVDIKLGERLIDTLT